MIINFSENVFSQYLHNSFNCIAMNLIFFRVVASRDSN